ncbi:MAG: isoprenylcysteine carboxylmethyltransferase family protein [Desulfobacteraceae bacterium]|nr:isoprenylcysteine carboxylmethyltransferase family protein [Desulfobacteraceae bacterium]
MKGSVLIILFHQIIFQGMFFAKNISLRRKLGMPIRGRNREANLSIGFFGLFTILSVFLGLFNAPLGTVNLVAGSTALITVLALLAVNLLVGAASLTGLRDSWRVGVLEDQQTDLIEGGIYRFSRNPYFLSYLIMFAAYTVLLQNIILLVLSIAGFAMIHAMVLKEEKYLTALHGDKYRQYQERVPRYIII